MYHDLLTAVKGNPCGLFRKNVLYPVVSINLQIYQPMVKHQTRDDYFFDGWLRDFICMGEGLRRPDLVFVSLFSRSTDFRILHPSFSCLPADQLVRLLVFCSRQTAMGQ